MADEDFSIFAKIGVDDSGFQEAIDHMNTSLSGWGVNFEKTTEEGEELLKKFGIDLEGFAKKLGTTGEALTAYAAIAAAAYEVCEKIADVGVEFEEASSKIERATGASSDALGDLNASFQKVMASGISQDMNDVAAGFSELSVKLGISGQPLESLTKSFAEFAEVSGTSVKDAVASVTDVMNKWNIDVAQAPVLLDQLTKASQLSGISEQELAQELKAGGAQFQELGLSLTESTAMLAAFGKDGVNAGVVLTGLRTAVKEAAKEGKDGSEVLENAFQKIKDAKSPTDALTIAISTFGSKAGPEMANAIRSGKTSIEEFKDAISGADGTMHETAERSETIGEKWSATMNKLKADVAPIGELFVEIGTAIVSTISDVISEINNIIGPIFQFFKQSFDTARNEFDQVVRVIADIVHGNWTAAWKDAQAVVLDMVKNVLDTLSMLINIFIGFVDNLITASDKVLDKVGLHISEIQKVSLSDALGVTQAIKDLEAQEAKPEKKTELGKQPKQKSEELKPLSLTEQKTDDEWEAKIANQNEKQLERQKAADIAGLEAKKATAVEILNVAEQYDDQIYASFKDRTEKERTVALDGAAQKKASAKEIAEINQFYDGQVTEFYQGQIEKRNELSDKEAAEEKRRHEELAKTPAGAAQNYLDAKNGNDTLVQTKYTAMFDAINGVVSTFKGVVQDVSDTVGGSLGDSLTQFAQGLSDSEKSIMTVAAQYASDAEQALNSGMSQGFAASSSKASDSDKKGESQAQSGVSDIEQHGIVLGAIIWAVTNALQGLFNVLGPVIGEIVELGASGLQETGEAIGHALAPLLKDIAVTLKDVQPGVKIFADILEGLVESALVPFEAIIEACTPIFNLLKAGLTAVANGLDYFLNLLGLSTDDSDDGDSGTQAAVSVGGQSVSGYTNATLLQATSGNGDDDSGTTNILGVLGNILTAIGNGFSTMATDIWGGVEYVASAVGNFFKDIGTDIGSAAKDIWTNVTNGFTDTINKAGKTLTDAIGSVKTGIDNVVSGIKSVFDQIGKAVSGAASSIWSGITSAASTAWSDITSIFGYATGTDYAPGGLAIVGEQGPELTYLPQGSKVINAQNTASSLSKSSTINVTFNSPEAIDETTAARNLRSALQDMAFTGAL